MRFPDPSNPASAMLPSGARASRVLGATALGSAVYSVALVWFAVDPSPHPRFLVILAFLTFLLVLPLSLAAMIFGRRARRCAALEPNTLMAPGPMGLVLSLSAIGVWLLVLLMTLPLFAGRGGSPRARDRAVVSNMQGGVTELAAEYEKAATEGLPEARRIEALETVLASWQDRRNPWSRRQPWLHPHIVGSGPGEAAAVVMARQRATVLGQSVFVLSATAGDQEERWLAGAVLTQGLKSADPRPISEDRIIVKTKRLGP